MLRRRPMSMLRAVLAASASALVLGACGSSTPTEQNVIARGNAICSGALRDVRSQAPPAGGQTSLTAFAAYVDHVLPVVEKEVSDLRALPRPAEHRALLEAYLSAVTSAGSDYRTLATAAARGDREGVNRALATLQANPDQALAQRYGLSQCASSAGTGAGQPGPPTSR